MTEHNKVLSYRLLDCGNGRRLEMLGDLLIDRPAPAALQSRKLDEAWKNPDAYYDGARSTSGAWQINPHSVKYSLHSEYEIQNSNIRDWPHDILCRSAGINCNLSLLPSGQIGIFPEQSINWRLLRRMGHTGSSLNFLNLFAYTGLATIAALQAGHQVTHVDAARSAVARARHNVHLNDLDGTKVRWIVEDATRFVKRELKRGHHYDAIILDPPAFGRGPGKQFWKIERDLPQLLENCWQLCQGRSQCIILSAHKPGWNADDLKQMLHAAGARQGSLFCGQLKQHTVSGNILSAGYCSWYFNKSFLKILRQNQQ